MPIIYLSPSTQENNFYVSGGTEEEWMNRLADAMEPYLTASGIRYRENSHLLFLIHRKVQGNLPAFRKFVGVGQQINDYLLHTLHIRHHPESFKRSGKQELIVRRLP